MKEISDENIKRARDAVSSAPKFAPEGGPEFGNAIAAANARAMDNTDFTSTTIQTLIATSNELLGRMNENVTKIDASSRYA